MTPPAPPATHVLALDAGNSSVKAAIHDGAVWGPVVRLGPDAAAWPATLRALAPGGVGAAGLASVVPAQTAPLAAAVRQALGVGPLEVSAALPLPFRMAYRTPRTLGADRLAAAVAAWLGWGRLGRPVVVLDAGTAVTLDVVDVRADGPAYLGGAIAPGPDLLRRSLAAGTSQLPHTVWPHDPPAIGTSTDEAIHAGVFGLFLDGVAGLLARAAAALGRPAVVIATGGWGGWLGERLAAIDAVAPTLVLDGVRALAVARRSDRSNVSGGR